MRVLANSLCFSAFLVSSVVHSREISYRGGLVVFDIPDLWVEKQEPNGGGMYYADTPDSGTLRLNVLTFKSQETAQNKTPTELLKGLATKGGSAIRSLPNGNAIEETVERATEEGEKITLYWWHLANAPTERHARIANFSYAVLSSTEGSSRLESELLFLRKSIERARFSSKFGE